VNRDELLRELAASRETLLAAVAGLDEAEMAQAAVMEGWSAKDLLAHVTAWEAELLKAMAQGRAGKRPAYMSISTAEEDARNEQWRKEFKKKPLDKVLEDYGAVRGQTIRQVEKMADDELTDARRFAWTEGQPLAAIIADGTVEHDREHAAQILQWHERRGGAT
jgi:uncharacterized damage-inducible protein DinB